MSSPTRPRYSPAPGGRSTAGDAAADAGVGRERERERERAVVGLPAYTAAQQPPPQPHAHLHPAAAWAGMAHMQQAQSHAQAAHARGMQSAAGLGPPQAFSWPGVPDPLDAAASLLHGGPGGPLDLAMRYAAEAARMKEVGERGGVFWAGSFFCLGGEEKTDTPPPPTHTRPPTTCSPCTP